MNEVKYAEEHYEDLNGQHHCLEYRLLVETGQPCRYGVAVLRRNLVTPVTLGDVVEDLL